MRSQHTTSRRLPASVVIAVIAAIALTALAVGVIQAAGPRSWINSLPPAKATVMAHDVSAAATARALHPTKPTPVATNAQDAGPTPTLTTEFFPVPGSPFGNTIFSTDQGWRGWAGSTWIYVYAGTKWTNYAEGQGRGALWIEDANDQKIGLFYAPDGSTVASMVSVKGAFMTIKTDQSASLTFNLVSHTWGS